MPSTSARPSRDQGDRFADRPQPRHRLRQHGGARGLPRDRRRLHRHGHPRGARRGVRGPAVVRQPRVEACRALRRPRRHRHPRCRLRPGRRQRLLRARRPGALRRDRHDRHPRRQRRPPRPVLRHQLRSRDQLPRVRQGVDVDRPPMGRVPDPRRAARVRLPRRRPPARLPQRPRRVALAVEAHRRQQHPVLDGVRRPLHQRVHRAAHARTPLARAGHSSATPRSCR